MNLEDLNHNISFYITPKKIFEEIISFFNKNDAEIDIETNTIILDKERVYRKKITFSERFITNDSNRYNLKFDKINNELNVKFKESNSFDIYEMSSLLSYDSILNLLHLLKKHELAETINDLLVAYEEINQKLMKERTCYSHISKVINFLYTAKTISQTVPEEIILQFLKNKKINLDEITIQNTSDYKMELRVTLNADENNSFTYDKLGDKKIYDKKAIRELKNGNDFSQTLEKEFKQFDTNINYLLSAMKTIQDVRYKLKDQNSEINRELLDIHLLNNDGKKLGPDIFKLITKIEAINDKSTTKNTI